MGRRRARLGEPIGELLLLGPPAARSSPDDRCRRVDRLPGALVRGGGRVSLLDRDRAALVVVDVQEGFRRYDVFDAVARACGKLVEAARILDVPRVGTEQYPKGL